MPKISQYTSINSLTVEQWQTLRPGDRVRCITREGTVRITAGHVYTVQRTYVGPGNECFIDLNEVGGSYFAGRFGLAAPTVTDHQRQLLEAFNG